MAPDSADFADRLRRSVEAVRTQQQAARAASQELLEEAEEARASDGTPRETTSGLT